MASSNQTNPALVAERAKASFNSREMTYFLDGGEERTARYERIRSLVIQDPVFSRADAHFGDRPAQFKRVLQKINRAMQIRKELKLSEEDSRLLKSYLGDMLPTALHDVVFLPNLMGQMSPEQQAKWVKKAQDYQILGCYAQTELGHGSNVRGLETTATFIPETDQFDIHSPTLTSTKWWPGNLGRVANFAVVYARLLLPDKDYGVHPFLVQIRSLENHKPLPGVIVGDIGPKYGTNTNDNGFLRFNHVRIPRENMLMKYAQVSREGRYSTPPHAKLAYGTMVVVRANIVNDASSALAAGVTIATRYSAVRKQGFQGQNKHETAIVDYRMQQYRLFPLIAASYGLHFTGRYMLNLYESLQKKMQSGDLSLLAEVHATSSGLKALTTWIAAAGLEECRRACGGHGFSSLSGLPQMVADYAMSVTVEGDNYLLTQQTTRFLLKMYENGRQGKQLTGNISYMQNIDAVLAEKFAPQDKEALLNSAVQIKAYQHRAALLIHQTALALAVDVKSGKSYEAAWNNALVEIARACKAHCYLTLVVNFINAVAETRKTHPKLFPVLQRLCHLFVLYYIEQDIGEFLEDGYMNTKQAQLIRSKVRDLLDELRPDAIALVDSFNISDFELSSALGRFDGRVYETLYEWAQQSELNKNEVVDGYEEYLKPLFHAKL